MTTICNSNIQPLASQQTVFSIIMQATNDIAAHLMNAFKQRQRHWSNRNAFQQMLKLDDHILADIGLTRDDVYWANTLPVERNAVLELDKIRILTKSAG